MATRLQNNSDDAAITVGSLEQQQVLDNLAMFVYNPNSLPYFSYPNQGSAIVSDQEAAGATPAFGRLAGSGTVSTVTKGATARSRGPRSAPLGPKHLGDFLLTALGLSATGQVTNQQSYTLTPINDPRKLELMRCCLSTGHQPLLRRGTAKGCPDCQARFNTFYTGDPNGNIQQSSVGTVTSECLKSSYCWFHAGCKKDVPKHCECLPVGHYCGVYVWVTCEGRNEPVDAHAGDPRLRAARSARAAEQASQLLHRRLGLADAAKGRGGHGDGKWRSTSSRRACSTFPRPRRSASSNCCSSGSNSCSSSWMPSTPRRQEAASRGGDKAATAGGKSGGANPMNHANPRRDGRDPAQALLPR